MPGLRRNFFIGNGNVNHDALWSIIKPNLAVECGSALTLDEICAEAAPCRRAHLRSVLLRRGGPSSPPIRERHWPTHA
jgi:hypothetical protein